MFYGNCFSQNVYTEVSDYARTVNEVQFGTFQFVDASYSRSRPTLTIITTKEIMRELMVALPKLRGKKSEYTDYWILGIEEFKPTNISEAQTRIIESFYSQIQKYRSDNNLPHFQLTQLKSASITTSNKSDICKNINCKMFRL